MPPGHGEFGHHPRPQVLLSGHWVFLFCCWLFPSIDNCHWGGRDRCEELRVPSAQSPPFELRVAGAPSALGFHRPSGGALPNHQLGPPEAITPFLPGRHLLGEDRPLDQPKRLVRGPSSLLAAGCSKRETCAPCYGYESEPDPIYGVRSAGLPI